MSAPDFSQFLASLGGTGLQPLPSVAVQGPMPVPSAPMPAPVQPTPVPQAAPQGHHFDIAQLLGPMLVLGAGLAGNPAAAAGAAHGYVQAQEAQRENDRRQQALQMEQQRMADEQARIAIAAEQDRQRNIQTLILDAQKAAPTAKTKADYDTMFATFDALGSQYGLRPNVLRQLVPYRAPNAGEVMYATLDKLFKNPANQEAIKSGAILTSKLNIDTDGDGKPDRPVSVSDAIKESGYPIFTDPETNQPMLVPKKEFDPAKLDAPTLAEYLQRKGAFRADKGREPTEQESLALVGQADKAVKTRNRQIVVNNPLSPVSGTGGVGGPVSGETGLTSEGLEYAATQYRLTGQMPALGMGKNPDRSRIINAAASQAKALSQTPAAAIQKQFAMRADSKALDTITKLSSTAQASESKASAQAEIIRGLSAQVPRSQYPILNQAILSGKANILGDPATVQLYNAITTFANEYGKIIEGSTASAQGSSDAARRAASSLINARMNGRTVDAVLNLMQREMQLTLMGYDATQKAITEKMGGGGGGASVAAPSGSVRDRARQILQQGGYDTSDASIDRFLANPKNAALLGGGG